MEQTRVIIRVLCDKNHNKRKGGLHMIGSPLAILFIMSGIVCFLAIWLIIRYKKGY
jgi:hypothetical protein